MTERVILNNVQIEIEGKITERQVNPWTGKISTGTTEFGDFAPCSIKEYSDLRGGLGIDSEESDSDRFSSSTSVETTKDKYITLGALVSTLGTFNAIPLKIIDFDGYTHFFANSLAQYNNAGTLTTSDSSPLATPTDALVIQDATDNYLVVCNGSDVRYATTAAAWSALSTSDVKYMCGFDKRLIGVNSLGNTIFYSARDNIDDAAGGEMSSFSISGEWSAAYDLFMGKAINSDDDMIYMQTDKGLVTIDFWTRVAYLSEVRSNSSYNLCGMYWNADVYASTGSGIKKINSEIAGDFGVDQDDGLPSDVAGYVYDIIGTAYWIVIAVSGNTKSCILKRHQTIGGWHEIYTSTSNIRCVYFSPLNSGRLYFGEGSAIKYIQFPDTSKDFTKVSGYLNALSGEVIFPAWSKLSIIPKIGIAIESLTASCATNSNITIYGRTDANITSNTAANWISYGAFNSNGHPTELALGSSLGLAFNDIQLKAVLASNLTNTTPILKSLALKYIPNSTRVSSWEFNISATGNDAKRIVTDIQTAMDNSILVNFSPDGDLNISTKYVKVMSAPSLQDFDEAASQKGYRVVVSELE